MRRLTLTIAWLFLSVCPFLPLEAQQSSVTSAPAVVPNMTRFSGTLTDLNGKPLTSITGVTFSLYKDEQGGAPLWVETQNVIPDKSGRYSVLLGSTTATGLPADVFASGEARWLGVRADGQDENARVVLVSVPYALKAADAETLGGLPASAFLQATSGSLIPVQHTANAATASAASVTGSGTAGFLPLWTSATQLGNSRLFQTGGAVGIGTTKPAYALDVNGRINSALGYYLDGSAFATASISLNSSFFGFAGNASATGRGNVGLGWRAAASLTNGGSNAAVGVLALNNTTTGLQDSGFGASALFANTTGVDNTALGWEGLYDNSTGSYNTAVGAGAIYANATGSYNTSVGYNSGNVTAESDGSDNTFIGALSGPGNIANLSNATAIGYKAQVSVNNGLVLGQPGTLVGIGTSMPTTPLTIQADDNGSSRSGVPHQLQIQGASSPNKQLLIGYLADSLSDVGFGAIQATDSGVQNTWVSLQPVGGTVAIGELVPITGAPLEIAQAKGNAVADGWATYSSRRWKTNIKTLHGSLGKIERMRGVSYDLKANGKHEIGVIAEEVGAVVPEVVQWEKNGKDAEGVDYSRMVALLIEGIKEQQAQIHQQQLQIRAQQRQIASQRAQMTQVTSRMKSLENSFRLTRQVTGQQNPGQQVEAELQVVHSH